MSFAVTRFATGLFRLGWGAIALAVGALPGHAAFDPSRPNEVVFTPTPARYVRLFIPESQQGQVCIDELEVYGPEGKENLARADRGAKAGASSLLPGYAIHQITHLNDGLYGNSHSWIAAGTRKEWAQIELPQREVVARVVFSRDREGRFQDRLPAAVEVRVSEDGAAWRTVARISDVPFLPEGPLREADLLRYAFECENATMRKVDATDAMQRVLRQFGQLVERLAARGVDVARERAELADFRREAQALGNAGPGTEKHRELFWRTRLAKREVFFRDPELAALERLLFLKRQPFEPSHNYSDLFDSQGAPGGGICVLEIPRRDGRLRPGEARVITLFDSTNGIARDPALSFDARQVYFGYRPSKQDYYHLWRINVDGSGARRLTDGPFHDFYPCPLPDGGLAFMSTRCKARFLCWRPQAFVLFRMMPDGREIQPLSHANLSEWTPTVMRDGRLLWMRSEYVDKGADFGHTLWAIRPDGTHPELIFGNNTPNCYAHGREVPGTSEIVCTLVSHGGDLNGPIALIDPRQGRFNPKAITNLTPDVAPHYNMSWARAQCFRDPAPVSRDYFLCSHAPADKFGLYVIDRWGNREVLYLDPEMGSMAPLVLRPTPTPPVLSETIAADEAKSEQGQFVVADVYRGLEPTLKRGQVKYLRICQEVRADLLRLPNGEYQQDHEPFIDWYATPIDKVNGPYGWPSYSAKGDLGLVPVEADGSANFFAPAGKVLYFEALDADFNELQRMRSVVQLQPGERRSCVGCHENRMTTPAHDRTIPLAMKRPPSQPEAPPWGAGAFAYEQVVQPVWDAKCVRCHDANDKRRLNFTGKPDASGVPASYRTLIEQGWVHYFDFTWSKRHNKAEPLTFGTLKSKLWPVLDAGHYQVELTRDERRRVKTWIDLNCPLWPDYQFRLNRFGVQAAKAGKS